MLWYQFGLIARSLKISAGYKVAHPDFAQTGDAKITRIQVFPLFPFGYNRLKLYNSMQY